MNNLVIQAQNGNKYFYINSVVIGEKIKHIVAGFNTGVITTLEDSNLQVYKESLFKMRSECNDI